MTNAWYLAMGGHQVGPLSTDDVQKHIANGGANAGTLCWSAGMKEWGALGAVAPFSTSFSAGGSTPPAGPPARAGRNAHDIDFKIFGNEMQFVEVELDPGECAIAEAGTMMYMTQSIALQTIFGDGTQAQAASSTSWSARASGS
jgi:hypothetical protein